MLCLLLSLYDGTPSHAVSLLFKWKLGAGYNQWEGTVIPGHNSHTQIFSAESSAL